MKRLFGTDGIRGIVNDELTVELAMKLGNSISKLYNGKYDTLLIAMDTRNSGDMFSYALTTGAISSGMNVEICGVIPTPALAFLTKVKKTVGIVISASHNPSAYNGLKVLCEGYKIPDEDEIELEKMILESKLEYSPYGEIGKVKRNGIKSKYIEYVSEFYKGMKSEKRIAIDVGNGAAGNVVNEIFEKVGINADIYYNNPDGFNINEKCGSTSPEKLSEIVQKNGYDLGILYDGDADRCLFIDRNGKLIDGDKLMAVNAFKMKEKGRLSNSSVVATVMSNLGFEEYLKLHGIKLLRTQVGDKYVLEKMIDSKINIGGEQSGHIIFFDRATTGDGIITSLETIDTMNYFGKNIDELVKEIPEYPQVLKNVSVGDKKKIMTDERIENIISRYSQNDDYRLLVRPSGTEHKIRVMAEGKDRNLVEKSVDEIYALIEIIDKE